MSTTLDESEQLRLKDRVAETNALSPRSLFIAALSSFLVTVLSGFAGTTRGGTILIAVAAPLVSAIVTTHGRGRARIVGIAVLTSAAVTVTVTGVTFADVINQGRAMFAPRVGTFVPIDRTPLRDLVSESSGSSATTTLPSSSSSSLTTTAAPSIAPDISTPDEVECTLAGCAVTVHSVGSMSLEITQVELLSGEEFVVDDACVGMWEPDESCTIQVRYLPSDFGYHTDVLVIHQNLPGDPTYVKLRGTPCEGSTEESASSSGEASTTVPPDCGTTSSSVPTTASVTPTSDGPTITPMPTQEG